MEEEKNIETNEHPMSELLFDRLQNVYGFTKNNGSSYSKYLELWKKKTGSKNDDTTNNNEIVTASD